MPMFDRKCQKCDKITMDVLEPVHTGLLPCPCGGETERVWLGKASGVIPDGIPGGVWIKNGLCNSDGSPRRYDSHTEMRKEAAKRGLVNHVVHMGSQGSDKSKHTTKWH